VASPPRHPTPNPQYPPVPPGCLQQYDGYHDPYGFYSAATPSLVLPPMGYTPVPPPCYPVAPCYYHPTPAAPASRLPRLAIHAAYLAAHQPQTAITFPRREPTSPVLEEPQECGSESPVEERERSFSPPIDLLATVMMDVGDGQMERKGGPCTFAVGSFISELQLVAPSVDLDAVVKAAEGCKSRCGNALRLGKGLRAASGMLKRGASAIEAVARYVVS